MAKKELLAKARAFTSSIEKMSEKQRVSNPDGKYGDDYNRLRSLTLEAYPPLSKFLPPAVEVDTSISGSHFTVQNYGEIHTYCEQIFQLVYEQPS